MKLIKLFLIVFITSLFIPIAFAGKGYDVSSIAWSTKTGKRYCPTGKILTEQYSNKKQARTGTAKCYIADNSAPTINVNGNGYISGNWTKNNVNLNISISENGSGIRQIYYTINGERTNASNNFSLSFSEEGTYTISIVAEDKALYSSYNGTYTGKGNTKIIRYVVNIDKSAPVFIELPNTESGWVSGGNTLSFKIDDTYKGKSIVTKIFECGTLPENSTWNFPVINGEVQGFCDNDLKNCNLNSSFTPNNSSCGINSYSCNDGYTKGSDGKCHMSFMQLQCNSDILPENVYSYNNKNILEIEGPSQGKVIWNNPIGIDLEGNFISNYTGIDDNYKPTINECTYECNGGYVNLFGKCINDTKIVCCNEPLLSENTFSTNSIDCTLPENQNSVQCSYSSICGWQKELFSIWNYNTNQWDYTTSSDGTLEGEAGRSQHCGFVLFENSDGENCNPGFYLFKAPNGKPISCEETNIGYWSGFENEYFECTNKPSNSYYISAGTNNDCEWTCELGYTSNGSRCIKNTWETGDWSECTKDCGTGIQYRDVVCKDYKGRTLENFKCIEEKPSEEQECNTNICIEDILTYSWITNDWSTCDASCGEGTRNRNVYCQNDLTGEQVSDFMCSSRKPDSSETCVNPDNIYCSYTYNKYYYNSNNCNGDYDILTNEESNLYNNLSDCENAINNYNKWGECRNSSGGWKKKYVIENTCN